MQFSIIFPSVLLLCSAAMALSSNNATIHVVQVGLNSSLTFSPDNIQAKAGEIIQFQFRTKNHSVVQSTFASPCDAIDTDTTNVTGFSSGFMPVNNNSIPVFSIVVNDTKPIYAHCSQTGHCAKGMVFAVNAPTNETQNFSAFKSLALASANATVSSANSTTKSVSSASNAASASAAVAAASSATRTPLMTAKGARSFIDMALLMLFAVFGVCFIGL